MASAQIIQLEPGEEVAQFTALGDEVDRFAFTVDQRGRFTIEYQGKRFTDDTLRGVTEAVKKARRTAKVKLAIPVTVVSYENLTDAVITGVHGGTNNLIVKPEDGSATYQLGGYSGETVVRRMSEVDKDAYLKFLRASDEAGRLRDEVIAGYKFEGGVRWIVQTEIEAKVDG